ncbi:MAG: AmmeMemoRadiSam system radical SAM enzyme [Candidatus Hydrogenedentota bacterium]|nr:MAG: AmmeMemoRadiSam system radical SAM enzyme [Candidatus Hydrogenedentota bacterium]
MEVVMAGLLTPLDRYTSEAAEALVRKERNGAIRCLACGHRCVVEPNRRGACKVRFVEGETLKVPFGYVAGVQVDPIEKKPFFHVLPGASALSFGMLGCDLKCPYCQNWLTSQALKDPAATESLRPIDAADLVEAARRYDCAIICSTYNEPLITAEWSAAVFDRAREAGLLTAFVSNGNATPEVLDFLRPRLDMIKIDLKAMNQSAYRQLGGSLARVLDSISEVVTRGFHTEIVTLIVPEWNDDEEEIRRMARFLAGIDPEIPWHLTAFHPDYKMRDKRATQPEDLLRLFETAREEGMRYVYCGNRPGRVGRTEDTACAGCGAVLVERRHFQVFSCRVTREGRCPDCGRKIPGVWKRNL